MKSGFPFQSILWVKMVEVPISLAQPAIRGKNSDWEGKEDEWDWKREDGKGPTAVLYYDSEDMGDFLVSPWCGKS